MLPVDPNADLDSRGLVLSGKGTKGGREGTDLTRSNTRSKTGAARAARTILSSCPETLLSFPWLQGQDCEHALHRVEFNSTPCTLP